MYFRERSRSLRWIGNASSWVKCRFQLSEVSLDEHLTSKQGVYKLSCRFPLQFYGSEYTSFFRNFVIDTTKYTAPPRFFFPCISYVRRTFPIFNYHYQNFLTTI